MTIWGSIYALCLLPYSFFCHQTVRFQIYNIHQLRLPSPGLLEKLVRRLNPTQRYRNWLPLQAIVFAAPNQTFQNYCLHSHYRWLALTAPSEESNGQIDCHAGTECKYHSAWPLTNCLQGSITMQRPNPLQSLLYLGHPPQDFRILWSREIAQNWRELSA